MSRYNSDPRLNPIPINKNKNIITQPPKKDISNIINKNITTKNINQNINQNTKSKIPILSKLISSNKSNITNNIITKNNKETQTNFIYTSSIYTQTDNDLENKTNNNNLFLNIINENDFVDFNDDIKEDIINKEINKEIKEEIINKEIKEEIINKEIKEEIENIENIENIEDIERRNNEMIIEYISNIDVDKMIEQISNNELEYIYINKMNEMITKYEINNKPFNRKNILKLRYDINEEEMTSLHYALYYDLKEEAIELIEDELINKNRKDKYGLYPLIIATGKGEEEIAIRLLDMTNIELLTQDNALENNILHLLMLNKSNKNMYKLLSEILVRSENTLIHSKNNEDDTAIILAVKYNRDVRIIHILINNKANIFDEGSECTNCLLWACYNRNEELAMYILDMMAINNINLTKEFINMMPVSDEFSFNGEKKNIKIFLKNAYTLAYENQLKNVFNKMKKILNKET